MSRNRWRGDAPAVAQVSQFTVTGAGAANDTVTVVVNNKSVVAVVPATPTVATVAAAISAALAASEIEEFTEVDWTDDGVDTVIGTAATPGVPFVITSVTPSGTVTVGSVSTTTDSAGPNHWDDPLNWSAGTIPATGEDVDLIGTDVDILYGLAQSGVTLASLNIHSTYTGKIGLLPYNGTYYEYRATELAIGATLLNIGAGDGTGSTLLRINTGSVQTSVQVQGTSTAGTQGEPVLWWRGTHASNAMTVVRGIVGIAFNYGDTATLTTLKIGTKGSPADAQVYAGSGLTLTTLTQISGTVLLYGTLTTINLEDGDLTLTGTSLSITTATCKGGTLNFDGTGTITTIALYKGAVLDCSRDPRVTKVLTNTTLNAGCGVRNGKKLATFTNGLVLTCELSDVQPLELGDGLTITVA